MSPGRLRTLVWRESLELARDPFRLTIAFATPIVLMVVLGYGLSIDVESLPYAVLDRDRTPASRAYLETFRRSRYFAFRGDVSRPETLERRLRAGEITVAMEIPQGFQRDLVTGRPTAVDFAIDGTLPFEAAIARGYVEAAHRSALAADTARVPRPPPEPPLRIATRFWFNPALESALAFVPGLVAVLLVIVPAALTAVAVVREKEQGSIANLYATPMRRLEFLLGKQIPYVALSLVTFGILVGLALLLFRVPFRGSAAALLAGTVLYVIATTGIGLLVSCFTRTQIAALMVTILLTLIPAFLYSGFFTPVASLSGGAAVLARAFPATCYLEIAVGTFTKGVGFGLLWDDILGLAGFALLFDGASLALLRDQVR